MMDGRTLEILRFKGRAAPRRGACRYPQAHWLMAVVLFLGAISLSLECADADDPTTNELQVLRGFALDVQSGSRCVPHGSPYATLVFGLDQESNQFTESEISDLKTHVEAQLLSLGSGVFKLANRKLDYREYSELVATGVDRLAISGHLLNSPDQELLIFINAHRPETGRARYSLLAYTAQGLCAQTSEDALSFSFLTGSESESLPLLLSNFRKIVAATLDTAQNAQGDIEVDMCPVAPLSGGNQTCSGLLQDELASALTQTDDSQLGGHRTVSPALIDTAKCPNDPNPTIAMTYSQGVSRDRLSLTLKLMKSARILKAMTTQVFDLPSSCTLDEPHKPVSLTTTAEPIVPYPKLTSAPTPAPCGGNSYSALAAPIRQVFAGLANRDIAVYAEPWSDAATWRNAQTGETRDKAAILRKKRDDFQRWSKVDALMTSLAVVERTDADAWLEDQYFLSIQSTRGAFKDRGRERYHLQCESDGQWRILENLDYD